MYWSKPPIAEQNQSILALAHTCTSQQHIYKDYLIAVHATAHQCAFSTRQQAAFYDQIGCLHSGVPTYANREDDNLHDGGSHALHIHRDALTQQQQHQQGCHNHSCCCGQCCQYNAQSSLFWMYQKGCIVG